ncbi:beta-1,3-galactosyltransferase 9 [Gastrophryne carolinensis]
MCRLRTHQWCFVVFNVVLFHALLFGADFVEEYFLRAPPFSYSDSKFMELGEHARTLDLSLQQENISAQYVVSGSELCVGRGPFLLLIIFSSPESWGRRARIRRTWASMVSVQGHNVTRMFMLGSSASTSIQSEVFNESIVHHDIVQGRLGVSSLGKSVGAAMMLEWVVTFCPNARFIVQADQQTFVNVQSLTAYLLALKSDAAEDLYLGRVIHQSTPDRDPSSPHFVPVSTFSLDQYPDYCSGSAMVISQDALRKMYLVSGRVGPALPSDVFLGLCAQSAGVVPLHSARFSGTIHVPYNRCCYQAIFSSSGMEDAELSAIWRDRSGMATCSKLEIYYGLVSCKIWTYLDRLRYLTSKRTQDGSGA